VGHVGEGKEGRTKLIFSGIGGIFDEKHECVDPGMGIQIRRF